MCVNCLSTVVSLLLKQYHLFCFHAPDVTVIDGSPLIKTAGVEGSEVTVKNVTASHQLSLQTCVLFN